MEQSDSDGSGCCHVAQAERCKKNISRIEMRFKLISFAGR
jgi:hypothetical protein